MRLTRAVAGLVAAVGAGCLTAVLAAPGPKDPPPGPPMTEEQVRAALKDTGSIAYAGGLYRLTAGKVDGLDLLDLEFWQAKGGKMVRRLTGPRARIISVDAKAGTMRLFFGEMKVATSDGEAELRSQEYDLPVPRQGKRP